MMGDGGSSSTDSLHCNDRDYPATAVFLGGFLKSLELQKSVLLGGTWCPLCPPRRMVRIRLTTKTPSAAADTKNHQVVDEASL